MMNGKFGGKDKTTVELLKANIEISEEHEEWLEDYSKQFGTVRMLMLEEVRSTKSRKQGLIDYSHIVLIIAIWPGDRIRRPEHSTVEHGSCNESV